MVNTIQTVQQLLDYVCTYPNNGIIYCSSDMQLAANSDANYLNETKGRSAAKAHIFCSDNVLIPTFNEPILTIA